MRSGAEKRKNIERARRYLEDRAVNDHDEEPGDCCSPKGADLARGPLPSLPTLCAEETVKRRNERELNGNKHPVHPAFMERGQSVPHQPPSIVAGASHGA